MQVQHSPCVAVSNSRTRKHTTPDVRPAAQPDFKRQLSLHHSSTEGWQLRLWRSAHGFNGAQTVLVTTTQLPAHDNWWFLSDTSSPCGQCCLLLSWQKPATRQTFLWADGLDELVALPPVPAGLHGHLGDWLPGPGPTRLLSTAGGCPYADGEDDSPERGKSVQFRVLMPDGTPLAESAVLHKPRWHPAFSEASPSRACLAVCLSKGLLVLSLRDCSLLLQLPWPFDTRRLNHEAWLNRYKFKLLWSCYSQHLYVGSGCLREHHVCCVRSGCWLNVQQALPSLQQLPATQNPVLAWGPRGLLVTWPVGYIEPAGQWHSRGVPDCSSMVGSVPLVQAGAALDKLPEPRQVHGHVAGADFSPDHTWVALTIMQNRRDWYYTWTNHLLCVQLVRCRTGCVAATWRPEPAREYQNPPELTWASTGNRLLCTFCDPCEQVLLDFEGSGG